MSDVPPPGQEFRRIAGEAEARTAKAFEELVHTQAFGELLARVTENTIALQKIGSDVGDLVVRNLRLVGRRDITALGQQLARTEDKLEMVLQEVERLQESLEVRARAGEDSGGAGANRSRAANGDGAGDEAKPPASA